MKIRTQHVSNSSTSSYLILGYDRKDVDISEYSKRINEEFDKAGITEESESWEKNEVLVDHMSKTNVASSMTFEYAGTLGAGVIVLCECDTTYDVKFNDLVEAKKNLIENLTNAGVKIKEPNNVKLFVATNED